MNITWMGGGSVLIEESKIKVLINPTDNSIKNPTMVLYSAEEPEKKLYDEDLTYTTSWPGEYEKGGVLVDAYQSEEETIFKVTTPEGNNVCILPVSGKVGAGIMDTLVDTQIVLFPGSSPEALKTVEGIEPVFAFPIFMDSIADLNPEYKDLMHETLPMFKAPKTITMTDHTTYILLEPQG